MLITFIWVNVYLWYMKNKSIPSNFGGIVKKKRIEETRNKFNWKLALLIVLTLIWFGVIAYFNLK